MREIVLDTETTGLNPKDGDRVVEIGCVELVNRYTSGRTFHVYLNPERPMPEAAYKVHGLSDEFLKDKPLFAAVADEFLAFIDGAKLVIHNATFDMSFLNHELSLLQKPPIAWTHVIDTLQLARQKHPGASNNLDALCKRYGIDNSSREKHGALLDSELLAEVYLELIGVQQSGFDLSVGGSGEASLSGERKTLPPRPRPLKPRLTAAEKAAHEAFIKTLGGDVLWNKLGG
jgi:DNA polymerase-3 subunit epsilon